MILNSNNRRLLWNNAVLLACLAGALLLGQGCTTFSSERLQVEADNPHLEFSGRSKGIGTSVVSFGYSGARVRLRFEGRSIGMWMDDDEGNNYVQTYIDGEPRAKLKLDAQDGYYLLAKGLEEGEHTVEVVRATECNFGLNHFRGFQISGAARVLPWEGRLDRKIEFIGDSITCGYGVEVDDPTLHFEAATENFCASYSGLTARALDADYLVVSRSGIGMVRNYDGPFEGSENTMPSVYPNTFYMKPDSGWDSDRFQPNVVCINLGTNDFSTTGVNVDRYMEEYESFGRMLLQRYEAAQLVMLMGPMDNSEELRTALASVVGNLKKTFSERIHFLELSPQGSVGRGADYHPNRAQSRINADELTRYLRDLMDWRE